MKHQGRSAREEDTQPEIRLGGRGFFARVFPHMDRWVENRRTAGRLLERAGEYERLAGRWKERGHYERSGFFFEKASQAVADSMHIRFSLKIHLKQAVLLREAMASYALEIKEADRYDPGMDWGMYRVARAMGDGHCAARHFAAAVEGFERMIQDPALDTRVRLGRLKRRLLERICEKDVLSAILVSYDALDMAAHVRQGPQAKVEEVREWAIRRFAGEMGMASEIFMSSVEGYMPGSRRQRVSRP